MPEPTLKDVLLRLDRLEEKVGTISAAPKVARLSVEEVAAYHKVVTALWEDGTCGINETSPCVFKCNVVTGGKVVPVPRKCDVECTCGPCNVYGPAFGGAWRFSGLAR
jgi:hypothetical protein